MKINLRSSLIFFMCSLCLTTGINGQRISETATRYSSLDGLFSITIPPRSSREGGGPLEPYFTEGLASSYSTYWRGDDLYLQAGYVRFKDGEKIADSSKREVLAMLVKRVTERYRPDVELKRKDLVVNKISVVELSHQNSNGEKIVFRMYPTDVGVVRIFASFMPGAAASTADVFLGSLGRPSRAQILEEKLREATPKALPACANDIKTVNDLASELLLGKVKSVAKFNEQVKNGIVERILVSRTYFDEFGRMVKSEDFEFDRPNTVEVYGCIDGNEVSNWGAASYENRFIGGSDFRTGGQIPDKRYYTLFKGTFDNKANLLQIQRFNNRALPTSTSLYSYSTNSLVVESTEYNGRLYFRSKVTFDNSKRVVGEVDQSFLEGGGEWRQTYDVLTWDPRGNWTKRSRTGERFNDAKLSSTSKSVEIREISYF